MKMKRIRLIHWDVDRAGVCAKRIRDAGHKVDSRQLAGPAGLREMRDDPPDAVVIDLSRIPSQGRDLGAALRGYKSTRHVPLVFVDGEPAKVASVKKLLPDATYTSWGRIASALKKALSRPPVEPVAPGAMAGYSGTPLLKKLGVKAGSTVALVGAPPSFEATLGPLPQDVTLRRHNRGRRQLTLWFVRSRKDLKRRIRSMTAHAEKGGLWIVWPKKSSGMASDLSQKDVRAVGLASGLVDFKISAIDETWSGLRFTRRPGTKKKV
jgi:hypothetical protein